MSSRKDTWNRFLAVLLEKKKRTFEDIKGTSKDVLTLMCKSFEFDEFETTDVLTTFDEQVLALQSKTGVRFQEYFRFQEQPSAPYCATVSPFGMKIPFVDRDMIGWQLWELVKKNYKSFINNINSREGYSRAFCYGPPGSGKSRTAVEAVQLMLQAAAKDEEKIPQLEYLLQHAVQIFVCFANGTSLIEPELELAVELKVIFRMLYSYFAPKEPWAQFVAKMKVMASNATFQEVFECIRVHRNMKQEDVLCIFLNIDEFNVIAKLTTANHTVSQFQILMNSISTILCNPKLKIFLICLSSGTSFLPIQELGFSSGHQEIKLENKLLSISGRREIYSKLARSGLKCLEGWDNDRHFLAADSLLGGWGRPLEYLLQSLVEANKSLREVNMDVIMSKVIENIQNRYHFSHESTNEEIVKVAVLGQKVHRADKILANFSLTWESANELGLLALDENGIVQVPFLWIYLLRRQFSPNIFDESIWRAFVSPTAALHWQDWEDLVWGFLAMKFAFHAEKADKITLKEMFSGLIAPYEVLNLEICLQPLRPVLLDHQFPKTLDVHAVENKLKVALNPVLQWWKGGLLMKNAAGGDAVDLFALVKDANSERWKMLCFQCKWREGTTMSDRALPMKVLKQGRIDTEALFQNASKIRKQDIQSKAQKELLNNMDVIYIGITNRPFVATTEDPIPPGCAVVCQSNLRQFFGVFADVASLNYCLTFQPKICINMDPLLELCRLPGVQEKTAKKILKKRDKKAFASFQDLFDSVEGLQKYEPELRACVDFMVLPEIDLSTIASS